MGIDRFSAEGINSLRYENVVISDYINNVENTGRSNVGRNEDTVCGRTLCAVAGNRAHGEGFFANTLCDKGRRSAAVAVSCPFAAKREHCFAFFVVTEAHGVICAAAVIHTDNESTVFLNANHRTSCCSRGTFFGLGHEFAILNNHTKGYANCVKKGAVGKICVKFGSIERLNVARNVTFCILKYVKNRRRRCIFALNAYILTVIHKNTRRVSIVVKVGIHTANDIVAKVILVILSHLGKFFMRPVSLISEILVDLVVSGNYGYVGVRRVDFNYVNNLSTSAGCVIEHYLRLNSRTGNEYVIFFGDYVVVTVCTEGGAIVNNVRIFPIGNGCESSHRNDADKHNQRKHNSYYAC